jgi:malate dehydrogenase (quinone)
VLEFGTELVSTADNSLCALLGASPGASVAVSVMLDLLKDCFPGRMSAWEEKIRAMIPSYGLSESERNAHCRQSRQRTGTILQLYDN